jgi:tetratricopeptide (TPR) repeat protein
MKRSRIALLALLLSASTSAPAAADPPGPATTAPTTPLAAALAQADASDYANAEKSLAAITGQGRSEALLTLARISLEQGRFAEADRYATQAASAGADRLSTIALRARTLAAQGKVDEAIKLLEPNKAGQGAGGRRVRLALGELLIRAGRRSDAEPVLLEFASEYGNDAINAQDAEGLAMVGRAMHLLRHPKDANRAYDESERAHKGLVQTLLWRADLFLDKYDPGHAEEVLAEALKVAPHRADAMIMLARVKLDDAFDFEGAEKLVASALAVNPNVPAAYALRAGIALRDMNLEGANTAVSAGLAIDPNDLELLSIRAATRFLGDDKPGFEAAKKDVFARNKEYSRFYGTVGDYAEWEHRYDDVIGMMKEAVQLDPGDSKAWAQLGLMQTRAGDETEGVKSLEHAWKGDHFNVRVFNTLERLYGQWIPNEYESKKEGIFNLRYPKEEKAVLERYVPRMLGEAWGQMKVHYMFAPSTPVAVELYRARDQFSVRTSGLPNIGIQGVCFGHVVAAMSPASEPFNWGNVVWHELGHVFAIQLSKNHVPRWFTEGLSEYETMIRRHEWQRELDPELYVALKKGRLPGAVDMNRAFTHADGALDVTVAYYAASQMLAFTAEQFGFEKITRALVLWGEGKRTPEVIQQAFGITPAEYDAKYKAWEMARLARYEGQYLFDVKPLTVEEAQVAVTASPQSAPAHVALAVALLRSHKLEEGQKEVDEALRLDPNDKDAHFVAAKLSPLGSKDVAAQEKHLRAIQAAGGDGFTVRMALASIAEDAHDKGAELAQLQAAHRFDPTQAEPLKRIYDVANEDKRDADALAALRELAPLDQHDRKVWRLLLERLVAGKVWDEARRVGEAAIYVDVESFAVHYGYALALSATGHHEEAAFEAESALLCEAKPEEKAAAHVLLAKERAALGDVAGAKAHRDEALKLDPGSADAKTLKL